MVVLRATKKVLKYLPPPTVGAVDTGAAALGDWYVNRVVVDRRPLLVLVSSTSLLPILTAARGVGKLPDQLAGIVESRLARLGVDPLLARAEVSALGPVHVGPTTDRSVLGILTDFCSSLPYYLDGPHWGEAELFEAERLLAETPCFAGKKQVDTVFPDQASVELLWRRWSPGAGNPGEEARS